MKVIKKFAISLVVAVLSFTLNSSFVNVRAESSVLNFENDVVQPRYMTIPVDKYVAITADGFGSTYANVMFHITGSISKTSYSVSDINLNYSYYIYNYNASSCSIKSANVQYVPSGTTLSCICNVSLIVTYNGKTGIATGSKTLNL